MKDDNHSLASIISKNTLIMFEVIDDSYKKEDYISKMKSFHNKSKASKKIGDFVGMNLYYILSVTVGVSAMADNLLTPKEIVDIVGLEILNTGETFDETFGIIVTAVLLTDSYLLESDDIEEAILKMRDKMGNALDISDRVSKAVFGAKRIYEMARESGAIDDEDEEHERYIFDTILDSWDTKIKRIFYIANEDAAKDADKMIHDERLSIFERTILFMGVVVMYNNLYGTEIDFNKDIVGKANGKEPEKVEDLKDILGENSISFLTNLFGEL